MQIKVNDVNAPTKNLENDHVHILRLIDVMEHITGQEDPDVSDIEIIVYLIKNFADGLHHAKEENLLFPLMAERGFSTSQGPIAVMLSEHAQGRSFVRGMTENITSYKTGNEGALIGLYENMNGYAELLRKHISKENNILFRMADKAFTESDQLSLVASFDKTEDEHFSSSDKLKYTDQIERLAARYNI